MPIISGGKIVEGSLGLLSLAGTPVNGTAGTHVGAGVGALLVDTTTGKLYVNTGTEAAPIWTVVGSQS
jgi:hypothetical protein